MNILKGKREHANEADANIARSFFGGDLDSPDAMGAFCYVKTGQSRLLTDDAAIAKKW